MIALLALAACRPVCAATGPDRWQPLRENNPFVPYQPPAPAVEPAPPQLELRGVLVEGKVTWFNVYNAETKESAWVQRGDKLAAFAVKDYDAGREALILDYRQRPVLVAFKQSKVQLATGPARRTVAVASLSAPRENQNPVLSLSAGENQRLEQVAEQIRQRREQRRKQGSQT